MHIKNNKLLSFSVRFFSRYVASRVVESTMAVVKFKKKRKQKEKEEERGEEKGGEEMEVEGTEEEEEETEELSGHMISLHTDK